MAPLQVAMPVEKRALALVSDRVGLIIMAVIFSILVITAVILRFSARNVTKAGLRIDDWFAVVSLIFTLGLNGIFLAGTIEGVITGHSVVVNDLPVTNDLEILTQKYKYAYQTTEKIVFGLIKTTILLLWRRLFARSRRLVIICHVMIAIIAAWTVAFFFETVFQCGTRWSLNWAPIFVFLTMCTASLDVLTVFGVTDILTDLIILVMPIPLIWSLQMPQRKKIAVTGIFALGFFTIGAGIARLFYYLETSYHQKENPDFIADVTLTLLWSTIEVNVALIVCNLPVLGPIFRRFRSNVALISRRVGISSYWIDITKERTDDDAVNKGSHQLSDLSRTGNLSTIDGESGTVTSSSQQATRDTWGKGRATVASAGFSGGAEENPNHGPGILARTEISTTFEERSPLTV
ncbi:hypothetical protein RRF57_011698 [Xylaria bambusicola]|uniref:Rhodopsin domain-containing protein n=1 Tax=Xylaria bambusicola TaxID=326684 RepID=A0AAN7UN97_9PEZI